MTDDLARRTTAKRVSQEQKTMARDAMDLKRELERFCADIIKGGPYAGRARNIARDAVELAMKAAACDTAVDIASINSEDEEK